MAVWRTWLWNYFYFVVFVLLYSFHWFFIHWFFTFYCLFTRLYLFKPFRRRWLYVVTCTTVVRFKSTVKRLQELKLEIEHLQHLLELSRVKLMKDFDIWWLEQERVAKTQVCWTFAHYLFQFFQLFIHYLSTILFFVAVDWAAGRAPMEQHDSRVLSVLDFRSSSRGSSPAGTRWSRSNRGPVALCTLGLGLLSPPSLNGR